MPGESHIQSGYVLVDKPAGMSSHSCVQQVRRTLGIGGRRGTRAGHAGTLDPFATGLLLVLVGKATRLMPWVVGHDKRYLLEVAFGASSDTDDATGQLSPPGTPFPGESALRDAIAELRRATTQLPPQVSALHVDGVRAYRRARAGEHVQLQPRPVAWHAIELVQCGDSAATFDVTAGAGAYMRSLARDLGVLLGCGAHARSLRRLAVGTWTVDSAVACDQVCARDVRDASDLVSDLPSVHLLDAELQAFAHGQRVERVQAVDCDAVAAIGPDGSLAGIACATGGVLHPTTVFAEPAASTEAELVT